MKSRRYADTELAPFLMEAAGLQEADPPRPEIPALVAAHAAAFTTREL